MALGDTPARMRGTANVKPPACPHRGTWAAAGAGSSSSSRSSMVAAWSSRGSIRMLALEARSSGKHGRRSRGPRLPLCPHPAPPLTPTAFAAHPRALRRAGIWQQEATPAHSPCHSVPVSQDLALSCPLPTHFSWLLRHVLPCPAL